MVVEEISDFESYFATSSLKLGFVCHQRHGVRQSKQQGDQEDSPIATFEIPYS